MVIHEKLPTCKIDNSQKFKDFKKLVCKNCPSQRCTFVDVKPDVFGFMCKGRAADLIKYINLCFFSWMPLSVFWVALVVW